MTTTILVDADYLDRTAFEITVNFERMLERRVQKLDLSRWTDYVSLDAGLQPNDSQTVQVVFIYSAGKKELKNCLPANLDTELNATAIKTNIAEFLFASCCAEQGYVTVADLYEQSLTALLNSEDTRQLILVADTDSYAPQLRRAISGARSDIMVTLFVPQAVTGFRCRQEILTYSMMAAMNIRSEEII